MSKRMEFLKATGGGGWKTLETLVANLDRAGYWEGERSPAEKRRHTRKMIATLVFREAASEGNARRHVFASTTKAGESGERVYKQVFDLSTEEARDILGGGGTQRVDQNEGAAKERLFESEAGSLILGALSEETMRLAWPGAGAVERRRIALAAEIQHRRSEEALRTVAERCRAEGLDVEKLLDEYLRAAGASQPLDAREASDIAGSATEYFKVMDELGNLNLGKVCFETLAEARTSAVEEFTEREGVGFKEAAALFAGKLGGYADELQGVLEVYRRDDFGWTLDEHLRFAVEWR